MTPAVRTAPKPRARSQAEGGYAILLVLFLATLVLLSTMAVAPNVLTEGRREKEQEMIWRGKQYARGIKLFYRKTGKFPTSMDELTKPNVGNIRFMRQTYKDPMNAKDGEWRLIYVGPNGQLIGSLKPAQTIQLSGLGAAVPGTPAAQMAAQSSGQGIGQQSLGRAVGQAFGTSGSVNSPSQPTGPGSQLNGGGQANPSGQPDASQSTEASSADATGDSSSATDETANEALLASDPTTIMGGNIIGVGSKINQRSITVYDKAKNYKQFEFIWDPSKDSIILGGAPGPQIGTPAGSPGDSNSNPNTPGAPLNPQPTPPETAPPQQP
jgi:hypothetical protein